MTISPGLRPRHTSPGTLRLRETSIRPCAATPHAARRGPLHVQVEASRCTRGQRPAFCRQGMAPAVVWRLAIRCRYRWAVRA
ncbi:hypothetical protein G6F59_017953 [Rhizopus arrhizus]|nr:hypothetical protein G6F59_017953 [Rhizopus arrhizus]